MKNSTTRIINPSEKEGRAYDNYSPVVVDAEFEEVRNSMNNERQAGQQQAPVNRKGPIQEDYLR